MNIGYGGDTVLSCGTAREQFLRRIPLVGHCAVPRRSLRTVFVMYSSSGTLWRSWYVAQSVCMEVFHSSIDQTLMPCFPLRFIHSAVRFTQLTQWSRMMESDVITLSFP